MWQVLRTVLSRKRYAFLAALVGFIVFSFAVLGTNLGLLSQVLGGDTLSFGQKSSFLFSMYGTVLTNFTLVSAVSTFLIAVLFGVNIALLVYYIRRRQNQSPKLTTGSAGFFGVVSGFFGIGCAACGSVIVSAVFGSALGGAMLALLPLHGAEFGVLGVILLLLSVRQLSRRINDPAVCPV